MNELALIENLNSRKPKQIHLTFQHPKETWDKFLGVKLDESSYDILVDEDADVFTPEGEILFRLRKKILPGNLALKAFEVLKTIKTKTNNRGTASGKLYMNAEPIVKKDGTISNTHRVAKGGEVMSSVMGYYDRYPRIPYCRETAFNANQPEQFSEVLPFFQAADICYKHMDPERYAKQYAWVERTSPDFVIKNTSYTTITVNNNFQTAVHGDAGDLKEGLSNITVLRAGTYKGAHLVFPHYRAAVNLDTCDLMCFDSHHIHGNTALYGKIGQYTRVSLVLYYRERMIDCGSAKEELERAKRRMKGEPLIGKLRNASGGEG